MSCEPCNYTELLRINNEMGLQIENLSLAVDLVKAAGSVRIDADYRAAGPLADAVKAAADYVAYRFREMLDDEVMDGEDGEDDDVAGDDEEDAPVAQPEPVVAARPTRYILDPDGKAIEVDDYPIQMTRVDAPGSPAERSAFSFSFSVYAGHGDWQSCLLRRLTNRALYHRASRVEYFYELKHSPVFSHQMYIHGKFLF